MTSVSGKIASVVAVRGESGVAGEGRLVGVPKFHSWGKCTMPLTNINSDWMSNASSGLCIIGASVSEPHTSELNGGISLMYVCIVRRTSSARVRAPHMDSMRVI